MKTKKLILIFIALIAMMQNVYAAYDFSAVAPSGQTLYYKIMSDSTVYVIYQYNDYSSPSYTNLIGDLSIPSSVTYNGTVYTVTGIYGEAFRSCTGLTSVTIPNTVIRILYHAFNNCTGLSSITIPNSVTEIRAAFGGCTSLTEPVYNDNIFVYFPCGYAESYTIPVGITTISADAFRNCTELSSITLPNTITKVCSESFEDYAFRGCTGLTSVYFQGSISDWCNIVWGNLNDLSNHPDPNPLGFAHNLYIDNSLVTDLVIPDDVTQINPYAFLGATCLTSLTIGNSVTNIGGGAFAGCTGLTGELVIPESVTQVSAYDVGSFSNCTGLTSVTIPPRVKVGYLAFNNCTGLNAVYFTGDVADWCEMYFYYSNPLSYAHNLYINNSLVTDLIIPENVTLINNSVFDGASCLTSVTIPNSVDTIGEYAFNGCTGLSTITIPHSVTYIGNGAFKDCIGLYTVNFNATNCTNSRYTFTYCSNLETLNIGDNVTNIPNYTFYGCSALNTVYIPNSVSTIGAYAFGNCALTTLTIGNSVSTIGDYAFSDCSILSEIHCKRTAPPTIGSSTFSGVPSAIPVYIPCGKIATYSYNWPYFSNYVENSSVTINAVSADIQMGTAIVTTAPTCSSSVAVVTAYPYTGYLFDHWSNGITANPYTFPATEDMELLAFFVPDGSQPTTYYTITGVSADASMGSVTGGGSYASGTTATLTASANSGYHFTHWQDNVTSNPRTITVTGNATYTAYFESDGGGEQPSDNAPSIACVGVDMNGHNVVRWEPRQGVAVVRYNIYREGLGGYSQVGYVNATNGTEYSWVDDNSNTATQAYSYKISEVSANGTESDLSLPHTTMHLQISQGQGTTWNLSWTPYVGFNYSGYRIYRGTSSASMSLLTELSSSATTYSDNAPNGDVYYQIEVVSSGAKSITASSRSNIATSVQNQQFTITVLSDNTSMGTVSGGGTFAEGATTTISATPLSGYTFSQWSDGSTQAQRTITVTGNATYTAYFTAGGSQPQQYLITVVSNNPDRGTVTGGGLYDAGTVITITAEPFAGYEFVKWHDGNTEDFRTITVTADATYTAYFRTATEGINDVKTTDNLKIYTRGNIIVIDFSGQQAADGRQSVVVYDVMGRVIKQAAGGGQRAKVEIPVSGAGVYMVKVGDMKPQKVVVRR